jgi:hypothetical protein
MPRYSYNGASQSCGLVTQPQNTDDDVTTIRGYAALPLQIPFTPFIDYNDSADCQRLNPQEGQEQCHWKSVCEISTSRGRALCCHVRRSCSSPSLYVALAFPLVSLVKCLNAPEQFEEAAGSQDDIRVEAAQVITSLSYGAASYCARLSHVYSSICRCVNTIGSPAALRGLLHANAHQAFLYAISRFGPSEPVPIKAAFARALRAIAAACAELVGPSQWGLGNDSSPVRDDAKLALEYFFQVRRGPACFVFLLLLGPDRFFCAARGSRCVSPSPH